MTNSHLMVVLMCGAHTFIRTLLWKHKKKWNWRVYGERRKCSTALECLRWMGHSWLSEILHFLIVSISTKA
jgi:hypothetical protein